MVKILRENIYIIIVMFLIPAPPSYHILCTSEHSMTGNNEGYERLHFSSLSALIVPVPFQYALNRLSSAQLDKELSLTESYGENALGVNGYICHQHQIDMQNADQAVMVEISKHQEFIFSPYIKEIAHITNCQHCISLFLKTIIQIIDLW